jgi:hypothetical protein
LPLSYWLSHQYPICSPLLPHLCYMPCPSHPPWLDNSNYTWRRVQVTDQLLWIKIIGSKFHSVDTESSRLYWSPLTFRRKNEPCVVWYVYSLFRFHCPECKTTARGILVYDAGGKRWEASFAKDGHAFLKHVSLGWLCILIALLSRIWSSHRSGCEGFHLLGYNAVQSVESQSTFRRNVSPPSSGLKSKPNKKPTWSIQRWEYSHIFISHVLSSLSASCWHLAWVTLQPWRWLQPPAHASSSLADFSTLKMEAIRSSETSVYTRYTPRHIPEDGVLNIIKNVKEYCLCSVSEYNMHKVRSSCPYA